MAEIHIFGSFRTRGARPGAARALGIRGRVALITAGWEEQEGEDAELREHLGCDTVNLRLYERADAILGGDADLIARWWAHYDRLRALQEVYRAALSRALDACRRLIAWRHDAPMLAESQDAAIEAARLIDARHLAHLHALRRDHDARFLPSWWRLAASAREEVARDVSRCDAIAIDGGQVRVLLNRLRLFDLPSLAGGRPILAWAAGAMALGPQVVLFHDSPPEGPADPEVLDIGLALHRGVVPLPHARRRLRLDDPARVALFARRFAPARCVPLDGGEPLTYDGRRWRIPAGARRLGAAGDLVPLDPP